MARLSTSPRARRAGLDPLSLEPGRHLAQRAGALLPSRVPGEVWQWGPQLKTNIEECQCRNPHGEPSAFARAAERGFTT